MTKIRAALNRFWFEADGYSQMRLFQTLLGIILVIFYSMRTADVGFYYGEEGILPNALFKELMEPRLHVTLLTFIHSTPVVYALHFAYLFCLVLWTIGFAPRILSILCLAIHASFIRRNIAVAYGVDFIANYFFFYLIFADLRKRRKLTDFQGLLGSAVFRLCQLQVCVIYFFSGFEKVKGPLWWHGVAIWNVLANDVISRFDSTWLANWPSLIYAATFGTILWEAYFPALVWVKPLRYPMLIMGVFLHLGIATSIILPFFGIVMIITYTLFLDPSHAACLQRLLRKPFILLKFQSR